MTWQIECSRHNPSGSIGLRLLLRHSSSAGIPPPSHSLPEPKTNAVAGDVCFLSASYKSESKTRAASPAQKHETLHEGLMSTLSQSLQWLILGSSDYERTLVMSRLMTLCFADPSASLVTCTAAAPALAWTAARIPACDTSDFAVSGLSRQTAIAPQQSRNQIQGRCQQIVCHKQF